MVLICLNACSGAKTSDNVTVYVTTNDRAKDFVRSEIALGDKQAASPSVITIDPSVRYQTMDGFGAAVTGSTCYNLMRMAPEDRTAFLKETFSPFTSALTTTTPETTLAAALQSLCRRG